MSTYQAAARFRTPALARRISPTWSSVGVGLVALAVWVHALQHVDVRRMDDLGLVSVLPLGAFAALALVAAGFALALAQRRPREPVLVFCVVVLIVMLHGANALVEHEAAITTTYRHVGVTDTIIRTGHVYPMVDAYFNWPGFFAMLGTATRIAGFPTALSFGRAAPLAYNLLYLGPLLVIFRALTRDRRLIWLAVWLFYLANWVGQDYLSPQATAYFLHLVILAVLVSWLASGTEPALALRRPLTTVSALWRSGLTEPADALPSGRRAALVLVVVVVFAAIVPSHQLTPFATLAAATALVVFGRSTARTLPVLMLVLLGTWISFMTTAYLIGHLNAVAGHVGSVEQNVTANVGNRLGGSTGHFLVVATRLGMTGALWSAALVGGLRGLRHGKIRLAAILLALAPFPLILLQGYGGEMLMRVYLFGLPFMCLLAAAVALPRRGSRLGAAALAAVSVLLAVGCLVTRYGNERMDLITSDELHAAQRLYRMAPPRSALLAATANLAWKFRDYDTHRYVVVTETPQWKQLDPDHPDIGAAVRLVAGLMSQAGSSAYLIITRSEIADADLRGPAPPGTLVRLERALARSPRFAVAYRNRDAAIFRLRTAGAGGGA